MKWSWQIGAAALAAAVTACAREPMVQRAYDGHVVSGRFIDAQAYAAFLRAAIAEANGDLPGAVLGYVEATRIDPAGAEIWTRLGALRCRVDPHDAHADANFGRALALDATSGRAWAAQSACWLARGDIPHARAAAGRAAELDPTADGANALLARTAGSEQDAATRGALVTLTMSARDPQVGWDVLATWAQSRGDVALWARALRELVRVAPARREDVARAAEGLAGAGQTVEARRVAGAAADADERPLGGDHPLAARLAVDDAIASADADSVRRRATRVRLPLDEAAGRALLAGQRLVAQQLSSETSLADATAVGARLVLGASGTGDLMGFAYEARSTPGVTSAAAFVAFGTIFLRGASEEQTRLLLAPISREAIVPGDDRVVRPAVQLVSRGALALQVLPPDGVVELAVQRGEDLPEGLFAPDARPLDARHEYLALALSHPERPRAKALRARLAAAGESDPVIAAASALLLLGEGRANAEVARALLDRDPGDPLLAATAFRLADKVGDRDLARRARGVLDSLTDRR